MGLFDRRYAALGWIVWRVAKRYARKRAKSAVPGVGGGGRPKAAGMLTLGGLAAAIAGALWFWRRGDGGDDWPDSVERP